MDLVNSFFKRLHKRVTSKNNIYTILLETLAATHIKYHKELCLESISYDLRLNSSKEKCWSDHTNSIKEMIQILKMFSKRYFTLLTAASAQVI